MNKCRMKWWHKILILSCASQNGCCPASVLTRRRMSANRTDSRQRLDANSCFRTQIVGKAMTVPEGDKSLSRDEMIRLKIRQLHVDNAGLRTRRDVGSAGMSLRNFHSMS